MADSEIAKLVLRIQTIGEKEAKAALDAIDNSGKRAATGLGETERASSRLSKTSLGTTGEMKKLGRELTANAGEALGFGKAAGALGSELASLGPVGLGVAAALTGLVLIHKELNRVETETKAKVEATAAALLKQKQAADAATVAGARLALQQMQAIDPGATGKPGFMSFLKTSAITGFLGIGGGVKEAAEESILAAQRLKNKTDEITQAQNNLATAIKNEADGMMKADAVNINALSTLIRLGVATGEHRKQAELMLKGLTTSLNALPVSDTVGRAGLAGQIKELNDALFPKLHAHVEKLKKELKELSPLATAPHVGLTPDNSGKGAQFPGLDLSAKMAKLPESLAKTPEIINESGRQAVEAMTNLQNDMAAAVGSLGQVLGDGIYEAFYAAFNGEGIGGIFKAFGKTVLAGIGQIFSMMGQAYLEYGIAMTALIPSLANPFTSGPTAIAIGVLLTALGGALGAISHGRGTGASAARANVGTGTNDIVRLKFINRDGSDVSGVRPVTNNVWVIGPNDPAAQRQLQQMLDNGARR